MPKPNGTPISLRDMGWTLRETFLEWQSQPLAAILAWAYYSSQMLKFTYGDVDR